MENSGQNILNNSTNEKQSKEKPILLSQIITNELPPSNNNKKEITHALPLLEDMIKSNYNTQTNQSEKSRRNSVIKKEVAKEEENNKDNLIITQERKSNIKRKERKNQTINMVRKPRKDDELGGTIKVTGKISAKLETLIQRLGQNSVNGNVSSTRIENKYVMGAKIKAALEKFNKKEEEESIQKMPLTERKYKTIILPDSDKDKKSESVREKIKFIQEIDEDKNEYEDDEYEAEEEDIDSFDVDKNKDKVGSKRNSLISNNKGDNSNKKKKRRKKKKSIKVLNLSRDSSSDNEYDINNNENNKRKHKRKSKMHEKENSNSKSSKSLNNEESENESGINNISNKNKKRKSMKKKKTFNFSEDKSESKEKSENNEGDEIINRRIVKHKSGRGELCISSKNASRSVSSYHSSPSTHSVEKYKEKPTNSKINQNSLQNPININNKSGDKNDEINDKPIVKKIEYDKFMFKQYIVKNYHPKPVTIWKKQIKKYIPSKQIDFSLIGIKIRYKKELLFNLDKSNYDINKKRTNKNKNKNKVHKSICVTNNNNFLFDLSKNYNISKFDETFTNKDKKKNSQILDKKSINTEIEQRKRHKSIYLNNNFSLNEFSKKFNKNNNNIKATQKNNGKKKRLSVYEILQKRGFNADFLQNTNTESNQRQNKRVKFNNKNLTNHHLNKAEETTLKEIPEKENEKEDELIKETNSGVKYIVFQNKNELKTIYKKEKWNLSISKITSIFLKALIPKKNIENSNLKESSKDNKNIYNIDKLEKEKLFKNEFDKNNKIEKNSFKYISNGKDNNKNKDYSNKLNESSSSSNSSNSSGKIILNNKFNNQTISKKNNSKKENIQEKKQIRPTNNLYFNYISNINYNKETKKSDPNLLKSINSGSNISESLHKNGYISSSIEFNNNTSAKNTLTIKARKLDKKYEFITEKKDKKISKVKSKKARIKKFISLKDESEFIDDDRKRKGNLYDYYSSKKQLGRKKCLKEECYKQYTLNTNNKIKNSKYEYNSDKKSISLKKCCSGKNNRNISNNKKNRAQVNPITFLGKNNNKSSLIMSYRQKIIEGLSNKNYNNNTEKKKNYQNNVNKSMSALRRNNEFNFKLNPYKEISKIDAIKRKKKKKLIEINDKLIDAINYYNGPIDISCISTKKYLQTVEDLNKRALKNGYQCSKIETNYYKLSNSFKTFFVEIVKIRNNLLYYLIVKNQ